MSNRASGVARVAAVSVRIDRLDPVLVHWILMRASSFVRRAGRLRPAFTYREISRNLCKARRVKVNRRSIRRLVRREAPEIAKMRGDCWPVARYARWSARQRKATAAEYARISASERAAGSSDRSPFLSVGIPPIASQRATDSTERGT
jgi:hypothetical protein